MIEKITIKNFRGIAKGEIEGFTKLNIFVGRNNSGKSTVLDAIALLINPYNFDKIIKRRGWFGLDSVLSVFRYRDLKNIIEITGNKRSITIEKILPDRKKIEFLVKTLNFSENIVSFRIHHKTDNTKIKFSIYIDKKEKSRKFIIAKTKKSQPDSIIIDYNTIHEIGLKEAYSKVFEKGYEAHKRLLSVINQVYPDIVDIRLFSEEIGPEIIYKTGRVPMYAMGDGFKSAYVILSFLANIENGYILCEEPENYQHPSSRELVVKGICDALKRNQIFISTHSLELIDEILDNIQKDEDVKFFVLDLDQNSGELSYYSFDAKSAKLRRDELEADLRG